MTSTIFFLLFLIEVDVNDSEHYLEVVWCCVMLHTCLSLITVFSSMSFLGILVCILGDFQFPVFWVTFTFLHWFSSTQCYIQ